jgi:hypothetical protein
MHILKSLLSLCLFFNCTILEYFCCVVASGKSSNLALVHYNEICGQKVK